MTPPVELRGLSFRYRENERYILNNLHLSVNYGEVLAVVGLSGSGKTTLCYCISGIIPHIFKGELNGEVLLEGSSTTGMTLPEIALRLGIVFQNPETQLFFPTVEDEIAFAPENLCLDREEIGCRIEEVLEITGMTGKRYENPRYLSGGQKQLIALASVLSLQPDILVFDEVMAQIDQQGKQAVREMILDLKEQGKAVVMIDHDFNNLEVADRVVVLKQGRLYDFAGTLD